MPCQKGWGGEGQAAGGVVTYLSGCFPRVDGDYTLEPCCSLALVPVGIVRDEEAADRERARERERQRTPRTPHHTLLILIMRIPFTPQIMEVVTAR